jgi:hypothetical protein
MSSPSLDYNNPSPTLQGWISDHELQLGLAKTQGLALNFFATS